MRPSRAVLCFALMALASQVYAGERIGLGVKAGTLGVGFDVTGRLTNWFSIRGTINALDVSRDYEETGVSYEGDLRLGAAGVLVDLHPFKGNFRVTAGLLKNRNEIGLTAEPTDDIEIGGTTYTPAQAGRLTGSIEFKDTAPYLGIGYGSAARGPGRIKFLFDLGVLNQGSGDVSIASSSNQVSPVDLRQEEDELEDDIEDFKLWPVLDFGISFRL